MHSDKRRQGYQNSFATFGASPKSLQWHNYHAAAVRYKQIIADISIDGMSVLDAGCGMGDLLPYLMAQNENIDYTGVDITPEFIEIARTRYDGIRFKVDDPFDEHFQGIYDVVVCSGVLNANGEDWLNQRITMLTKLYSHANRALVFNMAGYAGAPLDSGATRVAYAPTETIVGACRTLSTKIIVREQYHPKDFTITMFK